MRDVRHFVLAALEASIYASPDDDGLTFDELVEVGRGFRLGQGEISDALDSLRREEVRREWSGRNRLVDRHHVHFLFPFAGDPKKPAAFTFVHSTFEELARDVGARNAVMERAVLLARAEHAGLRRHDVAVAIRVLLILERLAEENGTLRALITGGVAPCTQQDDLPPSERPDFRAILAGVTEIVARRAHSSTPSVEPLDQFAERLGALGHGAFRVWWTQTVAEFRRMDLHLSPLGVVVLAAALGEAALTLVADRARECGTTMTGNYLDREPDQWNFARLITAAKTGQDPILRDDDARRCVSLNEMRQRIHIGRQITKRATGQDLLTRPEEAREARAVLDLLVRRVLDWLARNPAT